MNQEIKTNEEKVRLDGLAQQGLDFANAAISEVFDGVDTNEQINDGMFILEVMASHTMASTIFNYVVDHDEDGNMIQGLDQSKIDEKIERHVELLRHMITTFATQKLTEMIKVKQ